MFHPVSRQSSAYIPFSAPPGPADRSRFEPCDTMEFSGRLAGATLGGLGLGSVGLQAGATYGLKSSLVAFSSPIAKTFSLLTLGLAKGAVGGLLGGIVGVAVGVGLGAWLGGKITEWWWAR